MNDASGEPEIDSGHFRQVLGNFPTGVTAVTAMNGDKPVGMAVGSFTSVSLDPPLVAFFAAKDSTTWVAIREAGSFCVNVMGHDQQDVCGVMASRQDDKFSDISWRASEKTGSPIIEGSIAFIDCTIGDIYEGGDHEMVVGQVREMSVLNDKVPLLFFKGGYGTFSG